MHASTKWLQQELLSGFDTHGRAYYLSDTVGHLLRMASDHPFRPPDLTTPRYKTHYQALLSCRSTMKIH